MSHADPATATRGDIEDFLFMEADLLDGWQLQRWVELFTDDAEYLIPPFGQPDADPKTTLFLVFDDRHRLGERAKRLMSRMGHSEFPHSSTRRMITNVRIHDRKPDELIVSCNFFVHRARGSVTDVYPGRSLYRLVPAEQGWRVRSKRAALDLAALRPQGKVSIIL